MSAGEGEGRASGHLVRRVVLALTFLLVVLSLTVSSALVVYTAWSHDLKNGAFALLFAVLSAQIAINWFLWRDELATEESHLHRDSA